MTRKFETVYGEISVSNAMFDMGNPTPEEGIKIKGDYLDGVLELLGPTDIEIMETFEVERLIDLNT